MRTLIALLILTLGTLAAVAAMPTPGPAAVDHPAHVASYQMDVTLDPASKTVAGTERITYTNPSTDTLGEVWLRLYLRAFSNPDSVWMRESGGSMRGFALDAGARGDIAVNRLSIAGADLLATTTLTDTLMRVPLPQPLAPGASVVLDAAWESRLPRVFARTGYGGRDDTFFMVGQWYPKLAVYDRGHWDTEPWHANGEFFNDFGRYDVKITLPRAYVVAGAGLPDGAEQDAGNGLKTVHYVSDDVTDFAFAASPDFQFFSRQAGSTEVALYVLPEHSRYVDEYLSAASGSVQAYSRWYGAYPHPRITVVDVPDNAGGAGGMEYPTLITGGTVGAPPDVGALALVVAHEMGHQWWPMQTATNEGREPWLDEGLTEYISLRYLLESKTRIGGPLALSPLILDTVQARGGAGEPINRPAWEYTSLAYGGAVYSKSAIGFLTLERVVGPEKMRQALANYLAAYRWKHPTGADFRASIESSLPGDDLRWFFDDYVRGGDIDYAADGITQTGGDSVVTISRRGTVRAPVDVRLTLADGQVLTRTWDGQAANTRYAVPYSDPIVRAEADPEHKLVAESSVLNTGVSSRIELSAAATLAGRLIVWFQIVSQWIGLFG